MRLNHKNFLRVEKLVDGFHLVSLKDYEFLFYSLICSLSMGLTEGLPRQTLQSIGVECDIGGARNERSIF